MYDTIKQFMLVLDKDHTDPLMLQFDTLDSQTNEIVSIVTNVYCKQTNLDENGQPMYPAEHGIFLRNITIKAAHIYQHELDQYDDPHSGKKEHPYTTPFYNDLDHFSRPY